MKCKYKGSLASMVGLGWFNRSILKCKCQRVRDRQGVDAWFNRSILKCKWRLSAHSDCLRTGLIEAYWNVNKGGNVDHPRTVQV